MPTLLHDALFESATATPGAIAIVHSRYRRWTSSPLQLLAWQMGLAACWQRPLAWAQTTLTLLLCGKSFL